MLQKVSEQCETTKKHPKARRRGIFSTLVSLRAYPIPLPQGGGWVQNLAAEHLGFTFLSGGSPYERIQRGGIYNVPTIPDDTATAWLI